MLVTWNQSKKEEAEQRKSDEVVNEEGAVPECPENCVYSLEKSAGKDFCEVSEEKVLDFPLPNLIERELDGELDGMRLRREVWKDKSLGKLREWA